MRAERFASASWGTDRRLSRGWRTILLSAVLVLVLVMSVQPASGIVGGQIDDPPHDNVGALVGHDANGYFWLCTGTLISPTVFLTASHCTAALEAWSGSTDAWVTFDPVFSAGGTFYEGTAHTNPAYGHDSADLGDVAVVVLDAPVVGIALAHLPTKGLLGEMKAAGTLRSIGFTAVGYGSSRASKTGGPSAIFYDGTRRSATQSAITSTATWLKLSMNPSTGSGGTCFGDSGGPHFIGAGASETDVVVSITVTGDSVCRATDVTYRMDTRSAREFLGDYVTLP